MKIALVSLDQVWEDKTANLRLCQQYIEEASQKSIDLIIFPEMTLTGFSTNIALTAEEKNKSKTIKAFQDLARTYSIAILFGVVIQEKSKALNTSVFLDKNGTVLGQYTKIHPFSFAGEDQYFNAGNNLTIVNFEGHNIGLSICYDLRFPELYSALSKKCDLIINIANWPQKRSDHWNTLLKARAIENQLYVIGVNRIGNDGNTLNYEESSIIYNANGEELVCEQFSLMKTYIITKQWTEEFKNKFSTTQDRNTSLYREII